MHVDPEEWTNAIRTHSGRSAGVEAVVAESPQEGGLSYAGVPHQDNLEEAVGRRGPAFLLKKQDAWTEAMGRRRVST